MRQSAREAEGLLLYFFLYHGVLSPSASMHPLYTEHWYDYYIDFD